MFHVFFRDLRKSTKSLIGWSIGMVLMIASSLSEFSYYQNDSAALSGLMKQIPQSVQTVFGMSGFDLSKPEGFFGVTFLYIALIATVHAGLTGANVIAKEERDRTTEFLFTKPVSRTRILAGKMLASLMQILFLNVIVIIASIFSVETFNKSHDVNEVILISSLGLLFMQLIFMTIGFFVAAINRRPKASASIVTSLLLVTFIVQYVVDMNSDLDWLKYLTPFKYFDVRLIIQNLHLDSLYIVISLVIVISMTVLSFLNYNRRDLKV